MSQTKAELVNGLSVNAAADDAITVDSSGRVLIGNTTGGSMNAAADNLVVGSGTGHNGMTIFSAADADGWIVFNDAANTTLTGAINYNHVNNNFAFYTNAGERVRIDSSGQVGINTDSPSHSLEVNGNLSLGNGGSSGGAEMLRIHNDGGVERIDATNNPSALAFGIGGTGSSNEVFRIAANKSIGINESSPSSDYHLDIKISGSKGCLRLTNHSFDSTEHALEVNNLDNNNARQMHDVEFTRNGNNVGFINLTTTGTNYSTSSDYRLKENETAISDGITRLKTLKPYRFNFIADATTILDGFFAHEVTAVPEAVIGTKDEVDENNEPVYQGIDQSKLVPLLTAALQEAVTKIETLETKVAALEAA